MARVREERCPGPGCRIAPRRVAFLAMASLLALAVPRWAAALDVTETPGGGLKVTARGEALSSVIERVAQKLGTKVEYEGQPPSDRVFVDLSSANPTDAILRLLDGQKISYAAQFDRTGRHIQRLLLVTDTKAKAGSSAASGRSATSPRALFRPPVPDMSDLPSPDEPPTEDIEPPEAPEAPEPDDSATEDAPEPADEGNSPFRVVPPFPAPKDSETPPNPATPPVPPPPPTGDDAQ